MTLKELQNRIERTTGKDLPTAAWLRAGNAPLVVSRELEGGTKLSVYQNGFALYQTEPYDKLKMDLMYINNMSIGEDLRLMFATVKILFIPESTEGIADGQVTASHQESEAQEKEVQNV